MKDPDVKEEGGRSADEIKKQRHQKNLGQIFPQRLCNLNYICAASNVLVARHPFIPVIAAPCTIHRCANRKMTRRGKIEIMMPARTSD